MAKRGIEFDAGGRQFRLHLGSWAMSRFERRTKELDSDGRGQSVLVAAQNMAADPESLEFDKLMLLFWAGLEPEVSEREAADIMDELGLARASEMLGQSLEAALDGLVEKDEAAAAKNPASVSGTKPSAST